MRFPKTVWSALLPRTAAFYTVKAPDIISVGGVDYSMFADKGVLADLYDFMEKDAECSKDMLVQSVVKAYESDGHLYSIAPSFLLHSMWGYKDVIKGKSAFLCQRIHRKLYRRDILGAY